MTERQKKVLTLILTIIIVFLIIGSVGGLFYIFEKVNNRITAHADENVIENENIPTCVVGTSGIRYAGHVQALNQFAILTFISDFYIRYPGSGMIEFGYPVIKYNSESMQEEYTNTTYIEYTTFEFYDSASYPEMRVRLTTSSDYQSYLSYYNFEIRITCLEPDIVPVGFIECKVYVSESSFEITLLFINNAINLEFIPISDQLNLDNFLEFTCVYSVQNVNNDLITQALVEKKAIYFNDDVANARNEIYNSAYDDAYSYYFDNYDLSAFTWSNFFTSIVDTPLAFFNSLISFDFFGYDITSIYRFLVGITLIVLLCRFFI